VISDAHAGLKASIARVFNGASWQRCKVHAMRNILGTVPSASKEMVAATVRTIFAQPDAEATRQQLRDVVGLLEPQFPKAARLLDDAEADVTAYAAFPRAHWRKIASTNPLERINKEIKRRSNVVGIFPDDASVIRLVGAVLLEQHDDWAVATALPLRGIHGPDRPAQGGDHHSRNPRTPSRLTSDGKTKGHRPTSTTTRDATWL